MMLHIKAMKIESGAEKEQESPEGGAVVSSGLTGDRHCKLPIVPVQIKSKKCDRTVVTYTFLDQGSTAVFCTDNLLSKLNISERSTLILLRTMGQEKVVASNIVTGLEVAGLDSETFLDLPKTFTQDSMPVHKGNIPCPRDL